jgi:uncharacterized protein
MASVDDKLKTLMQYIADHGPMIISFSGGVDSGVLAAVAHGVLGEKAVCVLLSSSLIPHREISEALHMAETIGIECRIVPFPILEDPAFCSNPPDRCYTCKKKAAVILKEYAQRNGYASVADGLNTSDSGEYRPGVRASDEEGILHPYLVAGISKDEIREIAEMLNLYFSSKPSSACFASRIPYNEAITTENLAMTEQAEDALWALGLTRFRVRSHGTIARIELEPAGIEIAMRKRDWIVRKLKDAGFLYVTLDLEGFRSGSMDESLQRYR